MLDVSNHGELIDLVILGLGWLMSDEIYDRIERRRLCRHKAWKSVC